MEAHIVAIVGWLSPIFSAIIVTAATASINSHVKERERLADERHEETEAKRAVEAEWRDSVMVRLDSQDEKIHSVLEAQCTQMRSDVTHKIHRYLDDLRCASTEEKQSLYTEYEVYCELCEKHGITNHFVEQLINQVMELPDRPN